MLFLCIPLCLCEVMQEALREKKRKRKEAKQRLQPEAAGSPAPEADSVVDEAQERAEQYKKNKYFMSIKDSLPLS